MEFKWIDKEDGLQMIEEIMQEYGLSIYNTDGSVKSTKEVLDLFSKAFRERLNNGTV